MAIQKSVFFPLVLLLSINACDNHSAPTETLDNKIKQSYRTDKAIDDAEKQEILDFIRQHPKAFPDFFDANGNLLADPIGQRIVKVTGQAPPEPTPAATPAIAKIDLYIDATGSMRQFVGGNTTFQETVGDFISRVEAQYAQKLAINTVDSNGATPVNGSPGDFLRQFTHKVPLHSKNKKSRPTEILDIISRIVGSATADKVTVLFSDFNSNPPPTNANLQKEALILALSEKINAADLSVLVVQFKAHDNPPYYALILAKQALMQDLLSRINLDKWVGFQSKMGFKNRAQTSAPDFGVLAKSFRKGSFRPDRRYPDDKEGDYIRHLTALDYDRQGGLQFAVAVDFNPLLAFVGNEYLTDTHNFTVATPWQLKEVGVINDKASEFDDRDKITINQHHYTHYLLIGAQQGAPLADLTIALKTAPPNWDSANSNLQYLLEAITRAYAIRNNDQNALVNLTVAIGG